MKKNILSFLFLAVLVSCSSDSGGTETVSTTIDYFVEDTKISEGLIVTSHINERYDLVDGKYFSTTSSNGTFQTHHYTNGLLTDEYTNMEAHYTYNGQQLIAMRYNRGGPDQFRRFVAMSATTYYVEVLTAPYDDPATQVTQRIIEEFDSNDDLIAVGEDANFDGVMDAAKHFTYQNGDLTQTEDANGMIYTYQYTDVVNNYNAILENTYGKKSKRLIFVQEYLDIITNSGLVNPVHLKQNGFVDTEYEVMSNHYFRKRHSEFDIDNSHYQLKSTFYFK